MTRMRRINLALQGGGAHGAFTWGVLDRLLDEEDLEIAAISGTSAGALNGAAFKSGMAQGGREGARATMRALWERVGRGAYDGLPDVPGLPPTAEWMRAFFYPFDYAARLAETVMPVTPADIAAQVFSPYDWGPLWKNPLEPAVLALDIDNVCADAGPQLFVAATNVHTGKVRVFSGAQVTHQALLASACLPTFFRAVEVAGEFYWDGGYSANPALHPLYDPALPDDVVIVSLNPQYRPEVPQTSQEIMNRINEVSFNAALLRDLRAIAFVKRLIAEGHVTKGAMKDVLVHFIADDRLMRELSVRTKVSPTPDLIERLFRSGRRAAGRFLRAHGQDLNKTATVDLAAMFS